MTAEKGGFKPEDHFRNLKGQQYLEVKWRVVWFREEHPDGYITTDMVEHDADAGMAIFRARVGFHVRVSFEDGHDAYPPVTDVFATGYGSETRKDFLDYLEKAETKSIGRALAMLGYGTAQAMELDEDDRIVDSPASRQPAPQRAQNGRQQRPGHAVGSSSPDLREVQLRAQVEGYRQTDPEGVALAERKHGPVASWGAATLESGVSWLAARAEQAALMAAAETPPVPTSSADAVPEPTREEMLAGALDLARMGVERVGAKKGGPTVQDAEQLRVILAELQRLDPRPGETPAAGVSPKVLVMTVAQRLPAVAAVTAGSPADTTQDEEEDGDDDDQPF